MSPRTRLSGHSLAPCRALAPAGSGDRRVTLARQRCGFMEAQGMTGAQIIPELPRPRFGRCFFLLATLQPEALFFPKLKPLRRVPRRSFRG